MPCRLLKKAIRLAPADDISFVHKGPEGSKFSVMLLDERIFASK
jgi:hypothetical protein